MNKKLLSFLLVFVFAFSCLGMTYADTTTTDAIKGSLLIVGGANESTNADIYNKFIELAGGKDKAKIGIIPAASGSPAKYARLFKEDLVKYGVNESNIFVIPIAVKDEKKTADVDESKWADNGSNPEVADQIRQCTGIWFVGGDQTRITDTLLKKDGTNTIALDAIWEMYRNGGVIGGTSAGAAIMSETMIAGGSSLGALNYGFTKTYTDSDQQEYGPAYVTKGLGFFKYGVVDQHFDRKARLGRLIVVAYESKDKYPLAYGVDENTGMVVNNEKRTIEVVGNGGVTIVDLAKATKDKSIKQAAMKNIMLSYIEKGDIFDMTTKKFTPNPDKVDTKGYEYYDIKGPIINTGVFSPNSTVKKFLGFDLVDNAGVNEVKSYCFDENGKGVELVFRKTETSNGWWAYLNGGTYDYYSVVNVALDINPIRVSIRPVVSSYAAQKGDTVATIAAKFGLKADQLAKANKIKVNSKLKVGQKLVIPQE